MLAKVVARAEQLGYMMNVGPEIEYYYFKDREGLEVLDTGGYFDLTSLDNASDLRRDTILTLEKLGIPVEYSHHENGPSQQEIDLRFADAFTMADNVMTYKLTVKEIAMKYGHYASFMPKPMLISLARACIFIRACSTRTATMSFSTRTTPMAITSRRSQSTTSQGFEVCTRIRAHHESNGELL